MQNTQRVRDECVSVCWSGDESTFPPLPTHSHTHTFCCKLQPIRKQLFRVSFLNLLCLWLMRNSNLSIFANPKGEGRDDHKEVSPEIHEPCAVFLEQSPTLASSWSIHGTLEFLWCMSGRGWEIICLKRNSTGDYGGEWECHGFNLTQWQSYKRSDLQKPEEHHPFSCTAVVDEFRWCPRPLQWQDMSFKSSRQLLMLCCPVLS